MEFIEKLKGFNEFMTQMGSAPTEELEARAKEINELIDANFIASFDALSAEEKAFTEKALCDFAAGLNTTESLSIAKTVEAAEEQASSSFLSSLSLALQGVTVEDVMRDEAQHNCNLIREKASSPQR